MSTKKEATTTFHARIPDSIFRRLTRLAWKNRRSINAELVVLVDGGVRQEEQRSGQP